MTLKIILTILYLKWIIRHCNIFIIMIKIITYYFLLYYFKIKYKTNYKNLGKFNLIFINILDL